MIPVNKEIAAGLGVLLVMIGVFWWHLAEVKKAHDTGYEKATLEITARLNEAYQVAREEMQAENERLRQADNVRVETVEVERVRTEKVIEYIEREIPVVDTSQCHVLSADWVRVYNKAASGRCGADEVGAHCGITEAGVSGLRFDG